MADLKFSCPDCDQHILVDDSAAGEKIDCPRCEAGLIIPKTVRDSVLVVGRKPREVPKQKELEEAKSVISRLREDFMSLKKSDESRDAEVKGLHTELRSAAERASALERDLVQVRNFMQSAKVPAAPGEGVPAQLKAFEEKLAAVVSERDQFKTDADRHATQMNQVRGQLSAADARYGDLEKKFREVAVNFASSERERIELQRQVRESASPSMEIKSLREKISLVQGQLATAQSTLLAMRDERDAARKESADLQKQVNEKPTGLEAARGVAQEAARKLAEASIKVESLKKELAQRTTAAAEMERNLNAMTKRVEGFETQRKDDTAAVGLATEAGERAEQAEKKVQGLEADLNASRTDLQALREAESGLQADFASLRERAAASQQRVQDLESGLSRQNAEIEGLRSELAKKNSDGDEAEVRHRKIEELIARLDAHVVAEKALGDQVQDLEREAKAAREQAALARAESERLRTELTAEKSASGTASGNGGKAPVSEAGVEALREEIAGLREGLARAREHVAVMQERRDNMRDENARMKARIG